MKVYSSDSNVKATLRPMFVWYWRELHISCKTCVQSYFIYLTIKLIGLNQSQTNSWFFGFLRGTNLMIKQLFNWKKISEKIGHVVFLK
jgi:hypothetical protein